MVGTQEIITALDREIERLERAKSLLSGSVVTIPVKAPTPTVVPSHGISGITPEGRKRIATAQRKRWKALKKAQKTAGVPESVNPYTGE